MSGAGRGSGLRPDQPVPTSHSIMDDDDFGDDAEQPTPTLAKYQVGSRIESKMPRPVRRDVHDSRIKSSGGGLDLGNESEAEWAGEKEIQDFATIDWTYYAEKDRNRRKQGFGAMPRSQFFRVLTSMYDAMQSWLALALTGFCCGLCAAMVGMGADWANDMKFGMCWGRGFWITRNMCCKDSMNILSCDNWHSWPKILGYAEQESEQMLSYAFYTLIAVTQAGYAAWMCNRLAPYAVGSGIGEIKVILSGFVIKRFLGGWTLLVKSLGLILSVGSGLSIGKEGPFIHLSCCIGNLVSRAFSKFANNEGRKRELLSCACSAGIAVAFGAPIGGVLFSLEEVAVYFPPKTMWRALFCATFAAMTIQRVNPLPSGKLVMFEVTYHHQWKLFELGVFAFIGAIGGLVGAFISKMNVRWSKFRKTTALKKYPITEVMVCAAITSLIDYTIVYLRGSSTLLLQALFSECKNSNPATYEELCNHENGREILTFLMLSAVIKILLTIVSFGNPVPGGIFVPSLVIGALIGRAVGFALQLLENEVGDIGVFYVCRSATSCITPGIYAIVGAASVLGGICRMTVCLVVIMFEVTGGYEYVLPVMVGVMMSKWVADAFGHTSIYIKLIQLKGYPHLDNKREYHFTERASDVMTCRDLFVLSMHGNNVESIEGLLASTTFQGFPVVTSHEDMLVVGYLSRSSLQRVMSKAAANGRVTPQTLCSFGTPAGLPDDAEAAESYIDLSPWLDASPIQIMETTPLDRVIEMFRGLGLRYLLVTHNGQLVGILKKKDILEHIELYRKGLADRRNNPDVF